MKRLRRRKPILTHVDKVTILNVKFCIGYMFLGKVSLEFDFIENDEFAQGLIKKYTGKNVQVFKTTRVGATISLCINAYRLKKKVTILSPTNILLKKMQEEIIKIVSDIKISIILKQKELCSELESTYKKNPVAKLLDISIPKRNCSNCDKYKISNLCKLWDIILNKYDIYCLTYDKLYNLIKYEKDENKELIKVLLNTDILILDEIASGLMYSISTTDLIKRSFEDNKLVNTITILEKLQKITTSKNTVEQSLVNELLKLFSELIENVEQDEIDNLVPNPQTDKMDWYRSNFYQLLNIKNQPKEIKFLQQIIDIILVENFLIQNITIHRGRKKIEKVVISGLRPDFYSMIKDFVNDFQQDKKILFAVDACHLSIPLEKILKKDFIAIQWEDYKQTQKSQLIVCDTAKFHLKTFWSTKRITKNDSYQDHIKKIITTIYDKFEEKKIIIVSLNKKIAQTLEKGILPAQVRSHYFRFDASRGVKFEERMMFCVGGPFIPKHSQYSLAYSLFEYFKSININDYEIPKLSDILREDNEKSEFINMIGRVKDSYGKDKSIIFCIGIEEPKIRKLLSSNNINQNTNYRIIKPLVNGRFLKDGIYIGELFFKQPLQTWSECATEISYLAHLLSKMLESKNKKIQLSRFFRYSDNKIQLQDQLDKISHQYSSTIASYKIRRKKDNRGVSYVII